MMLPCAEPVRTVTAQVLVLSAVSVSVIVWQTSEVTHAGVEQGKE